MKKNHNFRLCTALFALLVMFAVLFAACGDLFDGGEDHNAQAPIITRQPDDTGQVVQYMPGEPIPVLSVEAVSPDNGQLSYQWYKNSLESYDGGKAIRNAAENSYTPNPTDDITSYWVVITNTNTTVIGRKTASTRSAMVILKNREALPHLTNAAKPVIITQPERAIYHPGDEPAVLIITAESSDGGILSYQWYKNAADSYDGGEAIPDADAVSYTPVIPASVAADETTYYWVVVTNTNEAATGVKTAEEKSVIAAVTVTNQAIVNAETPVIDTEPADAEFEEDAITALTVGANVQDGGVLSYQWYTNTENNTTGGSVITGATSAEYTPVIPAGITADTIVYYYVEVTNTNNAVNGNNKTASVKSRAAKITFKAPPQLPLKYQAQGGSFSGTYASGQTVTATLSGAAAVSSSNGLDVVDIGSGYIDLGNVVGNELKKLETWSLEMYVYVPASSYPDSGDGANIFTIGKENGPAVYSPVKDARFRISPNNGGTWGTNVEYTSGVDGYWPNISGSWKHLLFTLGVNTQSNAGELSVFENGRLAMYGPVEESARYDYRTTAFDELDYAYLGKSGKWVTSNNILTDARFYQFNVYAGAKQPAEILSVAELSAKLFVLNGAAPQLTDFTFTAVSGLAEGDANVAPGAVVGSFSKPLGGVGNVSYSLAAGTGDGDNGKFTIQGKELKVAAGTVLTYGKKYIRVKAVDAAGATFEKQCEITVAGNFGPLKLWYQFGADSVTGSSVADETGGFTGTLKNSASVSTENGVPVLVLGSGGTDYFDLSAAAGDLLSDDTGVTISAYVKADTGILTSTTFNEKAFWCFMSSATISNSVSAIWFYVKQTLTEIEVDYSRKGWSGWGNAIDTRYGTYGSGNFTENAWHHILYTRQDAADAIWVDGTKIAGRDDIATTLTELKNGRTLAYNYLGKLPDNNRYLKNTMYADFRIYNKVLTDTEIAALYNSSILNALKGN
jgi:hypothetical protein